MSIERLFAIVAVALGLSACKAPPQVEAKVITSSSELVGTYAVTGRNPNGSAYGGTVVVEDGGNGLKLTWKILTETWIGQGKVTSDGKLYVVYQGNFSGDGTWTLMTNGKLHGTWKEKDATASGTETWLKQ